MQVIKSYQTAGEVSKKQQFRLFRMGRPSIAKWRATRHGVVYVPDQVDQWIIDNIKCQSISVVDFAGWYLELFGYKTTCLESNSIAQRYRSDCYVEPDIFVHRPTYISESDPVIFRYPGFLRYAKLRDFISFLSIWCKSTVILNFDPVIIQHNYLKFHLIDLVQIETDLNIEQINSNFWVINV